MRLIARGTLHNFVRNRVPHGQQAAVKVQLDSWHEGVTHAAWNTSAELRAQYGSASILSSERVVFNIKGNDYRLIASVNYRKHIVMIKWIGTHKEYDRISALEVDFDKSRYTSPAN